MRQALLSFVILLTICQASAGGYQMTFKLQDSQESFFNKSIILLPFKNDGLKYDCFFSSNAISTKQFSKKNIFKNNGRGETSHHEIDGRLLSPIRIITFEKGTAIEFKRIDDNNTFVMYLPNLKGDKLPKHPSVLTRYSVMGSEKVQNLTMGILWDGTYKYKNKAIYAIQYIDYDNLIQEIDSITRKPSINEELLSSKGIIDDISFDSISSSGNLSIYMKFNSIPQQLSLSDFETLKYNRKNQVEDYNKQLLTIQNDLAFHKHYDPLIESISSKFLGKKIRPKTDILSMDFGDDYIRWMCDDGKDGPYGNSKGQYDNKAEYKLSGSSTDGNLSSRKGFLYNAGEYSPAYSYVCSIEKRLYNNNYWTFFSLKKDKEKRGLLKDGQKEPRYYVLVCATPEYINRDVNEQYKPHKNDTILIPLTEDFDKCFWTETEYQDNVAFLKRQEQERRDSIKLAERKQEERYIAELSKEYGARNARIIAEGDVRLGFTKDMCIEAWGSPMSINTITTNRRTREQWVYGIGWYLYFEGDKLVGITKRKK